MEETFKPTTEKEVAEAWEKLVRFVGEQCEVDLSEGFAGVNAVIDAQSLYFWALICSEWGSYVLDLLRRAFDGEEIDGIHVKKKEDLH